MPRFTRPASKVIPDDVRRGDTRVSVGARDAEGVVVVPQQPGALVVGVIVLGLIHRRSRIEDLVVQEAQPMRAIRGPPVKRPSVADPGDEPAVVVDRNPVLRLVGSGDSGVHGDNAL